MIEVLKKERGVRLWCALHVSAFNVKMILLRVKIWREKTVTFVDTPAQCVHSHATQACTHDTHTQTLIQTPSPAPPPKAVS